MNAVVALPQADAGDALAEAQQAWAERNRAQTELSRLRRYRGTTDGMKIDRAKWQTRLSLAEATLQRVLGGRA